MPACNTVLALVLAHDIHLIISGFILQPELVISCQFCCFGYVLINSSYSPLFLVSFFWLFLLFWAGRGGQKEGPKPYQNIHWTSLQCLVPSIKPDILLSVRSDIPWKSIRNPLISSRYPNIRFLLRTGHPKKKYRKK